MSKGIKCENIIEPLSLSISITTNSIVIKEDFI